MAAQDVEGTDTCARDVHGLEVSRDHVELLQTYTPIWAQEESDRLAAWQAYLTSQAEQLNVSTGQTNQSSVDLWQRQVLTAVLMGSKHPHAATVTGHGGNTLNHLIHMGIPKSLRSTAWRVCSHAGLGSRCPPDYYNQLLAVVADHIRPGCVAPDISGSSTPSSSSSSSTSSSSTSTSTSSRHAEPHASSKQHNNVSGSIPDQAGTMTSPSSNSLDSAKVTKLPACVTADQLAKWKHNARTTLSQIEKDINRTFPGHDRMQSSGTAALFRVLAAFSLHSPSVGYCQGMNFVAGALLLQMPTESDAFVCLVAVAECILPGYYSPAMVAPQVDQRVFRHLLSEHFPSLAAHLSDMGVDPAGPLPGWMLCGFVNCLPFEAVLRLWDVAFFERSAAVLFRAALALFELYSAALLGAADVLDASQLLHVMPAMTFDASRLMTVTAKAFADLTPDSLKTLQHCFRCEVLTEQQDLTSSKATAATAAVMGNGSSSTRSDPYNHDVLHAEPAEATGVQQATDAPGDTAGNNPAGMEQVASMRNDPPVAVSGQITGRHVATAGNHSSEHPNPCAGSGTTGSALTEGGVNTAAVSSACAGDALPMPESAAQQDSSPTGSTVTAPAQQPVSSAAVNWVPTFDITAATSQPTDSAAEHTMAAPHTTAKQAEARQEPLSASRQHTTVVAAGSSPCAPVSFASSSAKANSAATVRPVGSASNDVTSTQGVDAEDAEDLDESVGLLHSDDWHVQDSYPPGKQHTPQPTMKGGRPVTTPGQYRVLDRGHNSKAVAHAYAIAAAPGLLPERLRGGSASSGSSNMSLAREGSLHRVSMDGGRRSIHMRAAEDEWIDLGSPPRDANAGGVVAKMMQHVQGKAVAAGGDGRRHEHHPHHHVHDHHQQQQQQQHHHHQQQQYQQPQHRQAGQTQQQGQQGVRSSASAAWGGGGHVPSHALGAPMRNSVTAPTAQGTEYNGRQSTCNWGAGGSNNSQLQAQTETTPTGSTQQAPPSKADLVAALGQQYELDGVKQAWGAVAAAATESKHRPAVLKLTTAGSAEPVVPVSDTVASSVAEHGGRLRVKFDISSSVDAAVGASGSNQQYTCQPAAAEVVSDATTSITQQGGNEGQVQRVSDSSLTETAPGTAHHLPGNSHTPAPGDVQELPLVSQQQDTGGGATAPSSTTTNSQPPGDGHTPSGGSDTASPKALVDDRTSLLQQLKAAVAGLEQEVVAVHAMAADAIRGYEDVLVQYNDIMAMTNNKMDALVASLADRDVTLAALTEQLNRSMMRLQDQDADLAVKDACIEQLQSTGSSGGHIGSSAAAKHSEGPHSDVLASTSGSSGGATSSLSAAVGRFGSPVKHFRRQDAITGVAGGSSSTARSLLGGSFSSGGAGGSSTAGTARATAASETYATNPEAVAGWRTRLMKALKAKDGDAATAAANQQ